MKSAEFNESIARAYTKPLKTVTVYARLLKEAGLLTTGARGRNAPEMTPLDAARMTIAILATDSPSECVERVRRFGEIMYSPDFKKNYRGYETIRPEKFSTLFNGNTLEEVLAFIFSVPAVMGVSESSKWFSDNLFHLRISDFEVLAELFRWKMEDGEIVGEAVVPFKGAIMVRDQGEWRHIENYAKIKGGVRTERSISGLSFFHVGLDLTRCQMPTSAKGD